MSRDGSIEVHRLWKRFHTDRRRMLLRDEVERFVSRLRGDESTGWRWVLKDLDFSVEPGESVGLVGSNGSGKSTMLKILTRVMFPYAGSVAVHGRVGALIEVRAGIHPDLTGRENTYLFGSLLGLGRRRVAKRFDEIVQFAELESAIDRQVKFYSSGMQMRLGFAVAAFLEPDVLLVDEVLAVGDAAFQQKCLDRMRTVLEQGTTLVLVSHDLAAVEASCSRGIWLRDGEIVVDGDVRDALGAYRGWIEQDAGSEAPGDEPLTMTKLEVVGGEDGLVRTQSALDVGITLRSDLPGPAVFHLGVSEGTASPIFSLRHDVVLNGHDVNLRCTVPRLPLARGRYSLYAAAYAADGRPLMKWRPVGQFDVAGPDLEPAPRAVVRAAPVHVDHEWTSWS